MIALLKKETQNVKGDILSGLTVALALVPEAVAFAFVADIDPIIGLYGAFMMGLITAIFGGRPGMISGATGALAVVMVSLIKEAGEKFPEIENAGVQFLFATLILMGIIQILAGVLKFGKFARLIPHPVMLGFVNGLAIVIGMSQVGMFKVDGHFLMGSPLLIMLGGVALTMAIMYGLPKITKKVPAGLVAILVVTGITLFGIDTQTVGSFVGGEGIKGGLPTFGVPDFPFTLEAFTFILPYAGILAAIGLIESLMTLQLIDEMTNSRGNGNKECIAQGGANIVNGFFGGMGGCAMIGQSIININSGGKGRLSALTAALALLAFILFLSDYIEMVPIAALVGVMFMVVVGTFAWDSFKTVFKVPISDAIVIIAVTIITVMFDLAVAVIAGVIISALVFAWKNAQMIRARKTTLDNGTRLYEIYGPLFFGSITAFNEKFDIAEDPDKVIIDFIESRVSDHSGIEALIVLIEKYEKANKTIILRHLSVDCQKILLKSHPMFDKIIQKDVEDPRYYVLEDEAIV